MPALELTHPPQRRRVLLIAASAVLLIPALHPLLRPTVGVPSHLLWFAHILPVALVAYDVLSLDLREYFTTTGSRHLAKPFELVELLQHVEQAAG